MIRNFLIRIPVIKVPFKKELNYKNIRFITYMCKSQRKKIVIRQDKLNLLEAQTTLIYGNVKFYSDYPNHYKISLPALSPTMESGTIVRWEKKEGDKLNEGDLLAEIETDKATMGFETPEEGYLAKILVPAGSQNVPIGKLVCIIVENETDVAAFKNYIDSETPTLPSTSSKPISSSEASIPPPPPVPPAAEPSSFSVKSSQNRIFSSPLAKKLAAEKGLSLESINVGTGIYGSIKVKNVEEAASSRKTEVSGSGSYQDFQVSNIKSITAKRLVESKQTIPHYYLSVDINADKLFLVKKNINTLNKSDDIKLSLNDFIIKAMALACKRVPEANSSWHDTFIRQYNTVDVSVAVNTNKGLLTPIIFDADSKGLNTISNEMRILATKAREGKLKPHEFQGGTISLSNLGMYGITNFSAIINPPQTCILAVGCTEKRLVPDPNNERGYKVSEYMSVTLSCDHRTLDGAVGAQWLSVFRSYLEHPDLMLL